MLAQTRRQTLRRGRAAVDPQTTELRDGVTTFGLDGEEQPTCEQMLVAQHLVEAVDRAGLHAAVAEQRQPFAARAATQDLLNARNDLGATLTAAVVGCGSGILALLRLPHGLAEPAPDGSLPKARVMGSSAVSKA
jgi:hypothetical protein